MDYFVLKRAIMLGIKRNGVYIFPTKKEGLWTDFDQYDEDDKFFYLKNDSAKVCVPKRADLNCFIWNKNNEKWEANYSITEIYDKI